MSARKRGILSAIVELWHIYRLCRFVKSHQQLTLSDFLEQYHTHYNLSEQQLNQDWDGAWGKYVVIDSEVKLTSDGRKFVEFHGIGFINEELKHFNPFLSVFIALLAGGFIREVIAGLIWIFKSIL